MVVTQLAATMRQGNDTGLTLSPTPAFLKNRLPRATNTCTGRKMIGNANWNRNDSNVKGPHKIKVPVTQENDLQRPASRALDLYPPHPNLHALKDCDLLAERHSTRYRRQCTCVKRPFADEPRLAWRKPPTR